MADLLLPPPSDVALPQVVKNTIGGGEMDFLNDPRHGRQIQTGNPAIDYFLSILLNRTDALARECVMLRERIAVLERAAGTAPEVDDPFAKAVELAAKTGLNGVPTNGTHLHKDPHGDAGHGGEEEDGDER